MWTAERFDRTRRLALDLAGLELAARHRELLERRGRRLGLDTEGAVDALLGAAEGGDAAARRRLIGLLTTNFTGFFRHPWHFHVAAEHVLWAAHRRRRARVWSAAAATGEEPYSMAMALVEVFRRDDPPVEILATDVDAGALETARRGEYADAALADLEPRTRARFFGETAGPGRRRIAETVRGLVRFVEANLAEPDWPVDGPFDVVLCRNVLMYLEEGRRRRAAERIAAVLAPEGLLLLDPAEHLGGAARLFGPGAGGVFVRRRAVS